MRRSRDERTDSAGQVEQFHTDGFLLVEDLFDPEQDIAPILGEYAGVLDTLATDLYEQGLLQSTYAELPFGERLIRIYEESGTVHPQYFDFSLPQNSILHDTPFWAGPAVFDMIRNPRLLDAIESLIRIAGDLFPSGPAHPHQAARIRTIQKAEGPRSGAGRRDSLASGSGGDHRGSRRE